MPKKSGPDLTAARDILRNSGDATATALCKAIGIPPNTRRRWYLRKALEAAPDIYIDRWVKHETVKGNEHRYEPVFSRIPADCPRPE